MARDNHRTIIRRENPAALRRRRLAGAAALVAALAGAYYVGGQQALRNRLPYDDSADELRTRAIALETQLAIEAQTLEQLRSELAASRGSIDELERELAFYRGVIAPEEQIAGVLVREPLLRPTQVPGVYSYQLVAQQGAQSSSSGKRRYKAELQVTVWGQHNGLPTAYSLAELDDALVSGGIELNFRYFQRKLGELTLPPGFEPERVTLQVVTTKPEKQTAEYSYAWTDILGAPVAANLTQGG
jgi:hypothetical protein